MPLLLRPPLTASLTALCLLPVVLGSTGCAGPRPEELVAEPRLEAGDEEVGEGVFMAFCNGCHPSGLGGLGPGIINKPLPGFAMRFQVRHGLGAMPSFPERVIPDEELDALIAYIHAMRRDRGAAREVGR